MGMSKMTTRLILAMIWLPLYIMNRLAAYPVLFPGNQHKELVKLVINSAEILRSRLCIQYGEKTTMSMCSWYSSWEGIAGGFHGGNPDSSLFPVPFEFHFISVTNIMQPQNPRTTATCLHTSVRSQSLSNLNAAKQKVRCIVLSSVQADLVGTVRYKFWNILMCMDGKIGLTRNETCYYYVQCTLVCHYTTKWYGCRAIFPSGPPVLFLKS